MPPLNSAFTLASSAYSGMSSHVRLLANITHTKHRGQQREKYGIEGGAAGDFCASCCCACCVLIQSEKESVVRVTGMDPKTNVAYQPINQGMHYPA